MAATEAISEKALKLHPIENVRYFHDTGIHSSNQVDIKSVFNNNTIIWEKPIEKSVWITNHNTSKKLDYKFIALNQDENIKLPISLIQQLELPILESLYIIGLNDNWDGENSKAYTIESLKAGLNFVIEFYVWLSKIYSGIFYSPKIYHGPNGSIDLVWRERDFRLFINIDFLNNTGSYYCDKSSGQSTEGIFPSLDNIDFHLIVPPIKF